MEKRNWNFWLLRVVIFFIVFVLVYYFIQLFLEGIIILISSGLITFIIQEAIYLWLKTREIKSREENTKAIVDTLQFNKDEKKEKTLMEHSNLLKERVLTDWAKVTFSLSEKEPSISWHWKQIKEKSGFELAKKHINSGYKKSIWVPWKSALKSINKIQKELDELITMTDDNVYNGLKKIIPNIKPHNFVSSDYPSYTKDYFRNQVWYNEKHNYVIKSEGDGIGYANITVITGSQLTKSDIDNMNEMLDNLLKNEKILEKIKGVRKLSSNISKNLDAFKEELSKVILSIDDNNFLQGRCNKNCPNQKHKKGSD